MDKVSEFLVCLKNAGTARHEKLDVPASNFRISLAKILMEEGLIRSFKVAKDSRQGVMRVYLKYDQEGNHRITQVSKVSKPGRRVYVKSQKIPVVRSGLGVSILSTNKGLMTGTEAKGQNLGGEVICVMW